MARPTSGTDVHTRRSGSHLRASSWSGWARGTQRERSTTGTGERVSALGTSLRCLLEHGLRGEELGIPSPVLGCHSSCYRGKSGSGECGLLSGAVRGGRHGVGLASSGCWVANVVCESAVFSLVSLLFRGERSRCASCFGYGRPCHCTAYVPADTRERGGASDSVLDRVLKISVALQSESEQCKLCKSRRFHSAFLGMVVFGMFVDAPVVIQRLVLGVGRCRKTVEVPQLQSVQFLEVIDTVVVLVTTGACVGPDSAELVEILQFWTTLSVCRWCADTAKAPQLQLQFIDKFGSRACRCATTGPDGPDSAAWS